MTNDNEARTTLAGEAIPLLLDDDTMRMAVERIRQGVDAEIVCRLIRATYEGRRQADRAAAASRIEQLEAQLAQAISVYKEVMAVILEESKEGGNNGE